MSGSLTSQVHYAMLTATTDTEWRSAGIPLGRGALVAVKWFALAIWFTMVWTARVMLWTLYAFMFVTLLIFGGARGWASFSPGRRTRYGVSTRLF